ncbi:MAG: uroporphyrinogen decarboxylase family protein [Desulfobacterales bacterium]
MSTTEMTSLERVLTTLGHKEPDRVPLFLLFSMYGAKELKMPIKEFFSKPEYVVEAQLALRKKFRHDCIYPFFYAPVEVEAWGGEVIYTENGPPNSGKPFIRNIEDIKNLTVPNVKETPCLIKVLEATRMLKERVGDEVPIIGVAISPFSLPVMQLGFDKYIDLIHNNPELFNHLMEINEQFVADWANAQLEAGATAICYFDPVSSSTIIPRELYLKTGFEIAKRMMTKINGPTATHMASGMSIPILGDIAQTGTAIACTSSKEDLAEVKSHIKGKLSVLGNLNGIEMRTWTPEQAEAEVKKAIAKAGPGGGFILSDNHGEIPYQVPEEVLMAISDAVHKWGKYPLDWIETEKI